MAVHALLARSVSVQLCASAMRQPMLPTSKPPIVYRFGYTDQYFTDPAYIEQFRAAPPDLLHVGKAVPITHQWGPVGLFAGENQYTGSPQNLLVAANIALFPRGHGRADRANPRDAGAISCRRHPRDRPLHRLAHPGGRPPEAVGVLEVLRPVGGV